MYGENAFLAVINIITLDAGDIDGVRVSSGWAYYDQFDSNSTFEAFPENTFFPPFIYPDGMVYIVKGIERIIGTEIPLDVKLFDGNILTLGMEYRLISASDNHFLANFDPDTGVPNPNNEVLDYTDTSPFLPDITRRVLSLYLQDTWDITDTVNLTLGVRHDRYNDFGEATSPRVGLTWLFMKDASLKLLYGEAFRAPTFYEMFQIELGNRDLDPERIRTYELGLSYKFSKYVTSSINYFYNDIEDLIAVDRNAPSPRQYENLTNAHVQGFEMETRVDISKGNYVFMNYTFKNPEDEDGNDLPLVAQHTGNFGVNVNFWKYINTNLSTFVSGRRSRIDTDERDGLPAYALLNLSVIGKEFFKTMEVQGTVFNILDKDYRDPAPPSIPDDLPRPERTFFVGLSYKF